MNPIQALAEHGQSIWLDYIRRDMTRSGELHRMIEDGLRGMTSNPAIFQKSIATSPDYTAALETSGADPSVSAQQLYERIAIEDIREACDVMAPLYKACGQRDGFVSLEVAPDLAHDSEATVAEAHRLWAAVDRPNLMIKVPATPEGIVAVEQLIADGLSVNITLIFSCEVYRRVAQAYRRGLERRVAQGEPVAHIASVASFFISRIDSEIDPLLARIAEASTEHAATARHLQGRIAIANAKLAYAMFQGDLEHPQWASLARAGARPQRLLWASTGTKNPRYSDVLYIEELIGRDTVNTVPPATLDAFLDHGQVRSTLEHDVEGARASMAALAELGISMEAVTERLLVDGLRLFTDAMSSLLSTIAAQQAKLRGAS